MICKWTRHECELRPTFVNQYNMDMCACVLHVRSVWICFILIVQVKSDTNNIMKFVTLKFLLQKLYKFGNCVWLA